MIHDPIEFERVGSARLQVIMQHRDFACGLFHLNMVEDNSQPTFCTDGETLWVNTEFSKKYSPKVIRTIHVHEVLHCLLQHPMRRGDREHDLFNQACDYAINLLIMQYSGENGYYFELPPGALFNYQYKNKAAEEIYDLLVEKRDAERKAATPPPPPPPTPAPSTPTPAPSTPTPPTPPPPTPNNGEGEGDGDGKPGEGDGDGEGKPGEGEGEGKPGEGEGEGEGKPGEGDGEGKPGEGEGKPGDGDGSGEGKPGEGEGKPGDGKPGEGSGKPGEGKPEPAPYTKSPTGYFKDAPERIGDDGVPVRDRLMKQWAQTLAESCADPDSFGSKSGMAHRMLDEVTSQDIHWEDILQRFVTERCPTDFTFATPDNRFECDFVLPGMDDENHGEMVFAIDTSGSVSASLLAKFVAEAREAMNRVRPKTMHLVYFDSQVCHTEQYSPGDSIVPHAVGGGGTDFCPVFEWIDEQRITPICVIFLTDGYGSFPEPAPAYDTLWCSYGREQYPFGEVVKIKV